MKSEEIDFTLLREDSHEEFEKLYRQYSGRVYGFLMRLTQGNVALSEEIVQRVFVRLWEHRGDLFSTEQFFSLLCLMSRRIIMHINAHQTVMLVYEEYVKKTHTAIAADPHEQIDMDNVDKLLDEIAERLPPRCAQIFLLSRKNELTNKEIAQKLGISPSTVSSQLEIALKIAKDYLAKSHYKLLTLSLPIILLV